MRRTSPFAFALLVAAVALTGFFPIVRHTAPATLGVPFIPQVGNKWCWAACMEMMTTYMHAHNPKVPIITQCEAVKWCLNDSLAPCPMTSPVPQQYDKTGIPFRPDRFPTFGYSPYSGPVFTNDAMPYDSLCASFAAGFPVIFAWSFVGITSATNEDNGNHYMLAEGCPTTRFSSDSFVSIHDPLPAGLGHHRIIRYDEFANLALNTVQSSRSKMYNQKYIYSRHINDLTFIRYYGK